MPTIEDGQQAIEQGNLQQARLIFEAILQDTPRSEEAWLGLAEVLTETDDKRICYENVLKINKDNPQAREALRNLEPQANPLIEALQPKAEPTEQVDESPPADETVISPTPDETVAAGVEADASPAGDGPPTYALVAVGLLLSVVFFAVGGGLVFFIISAAR
jgi:hypothetical protein